MRRGILCLFQLQRENNELPGNPLVAAIANTHCNAHFNRIDHFFPENQK
jgi:hypothetical protein